MNPFYYSEEGYKALSISIAAAILLLQFNSFTTDYSRLYESGNDPIG